MKSRIEEGTLHGGNATRAKVQKQEDRTYSKKMASGSIYPFDRTCQRSHGLKRQVEVRLWMDLNARINKFML